MTKICYLKLVTGEEIVSKIEMIENGERKLVRMIDPFVMHHHVDPDVGVRDYAIRYMPLTTKNSFILDADHVLTITDPSPMVINDYEIMLQDEEANEEFDKEITNPKANNVVTLH
jgi:hypothetical protein